MQILKGLQEGVDTLNELDGSFSCLYYDKDELSLFLFRNEISPMYMDMDMNISSTDFPNSYETPPNEVLKMNFNQVGVDVVSKFSTVENPYFFGE